MGAVQHTWFWFNEFKPEFEEGVYQSYTNKEN